MAKRPVLPDNYNPIGDRLKRAIAVSQAIPLVAESEEVIKETPQSELVKEDVAPPPLVSSSMTIEVLQTEPTGTELKESAIRFRCTDHERKKWHSLAFELTGESGQMSHIIRSALLLIENSYEELKRSRHEMQRLRYPGKSDPFGLVLYEQRLAEFVYDAIKATGRPKW